MASKFYAFEPLADDGLETPEVGSWSEEKYRLLHGYARIFATAMKKKWDHRVYIDLFAGSGRSKLKNSGRIVLASPLLALEIPDRFNRYIFCEQNPVRITALRERVRRDYSSADVRFLEGDANQLVDHILAEIPAHSKSTRVLAFCFADPYRLKNLKFTTIEHLAKRFVDFLILIPTEMDANRNVSWYTQPNNQTLDDFVGTTEWREHWRKAEAQGEPFWGFLERFYERRMAALEYGEHSAKEAQLVRSDKRNLPLYRLTFFSRSTLGQRFWKDIKKHVIPQSSFNFD